jgi:hypothetical protein
VTRRVALIAGAARRKSRKTAEPRTQTLMIMMVEGKRRGKVWIS